MASLHQIIAWLAHFLCAHVLITFNSVGCYKNLTELIQDLNPRPITPNARIIPLDQLAIDTPSHCLGFVLGCDS